MKIDATELLPEAIEALRCRSGRVLRISAQGEIEWETVARENIRSDSHQVTVSMAGELTVCGSPARVTDRLNVFGSGDIRACARSMLDFVASQVSVPLPPLELWRCTRVDVTHNFDLLSAANVRAALMSLRHAEGGRYQLRTTSESVYWSVQSKYRSGKAYHKGPHLIYQRRKGTADPSDDEIELAQRLLRLELSLRCQFWRESAWKAWFEFSESDLDALHAEYFGKLVGNVEVTEMSDVQQKCIDAAVLMGMTEGRGKAAHAHWCLIQSEGFERARDLVPKASHYRHLKILRSAGLSWSDFQAGRVVQLRRMPLVLAQPVRSWDELRRVA
jgi:II/X family phage/plasmid replication protein